MKQSMKTSAIFQVLELLLGEPYAAMEAAKILISLPEGEVDPLLLAKIAEDTRYKTWSRISAVYVLGLLDEEAMEQRAASLLAILMNRQEQVRLRGHAAEALGNLGASGAEHELMRVLMDSKEALSLRKWCIYALNEIASAEAKEALSLFARTGPRGVLAQELESTREQWAIAS